MSREGRLGMVDREHPSLSLVRQCALLGLNRSSLYHRPTGVDEYDLKLMALIDRQYLETPFYGTRRMAVWLRARGHRVNRKRVSVLCVPALEHRRKPQQGSGRLRQSYRHTMGL